MDIIVTDFNLEDGTGPQFIQKYFQMELKVKKPIFILLTGEDLKSKEIQQVSNLYMEVLQKPVTLAAWTTAFQKCLKKLGKNLTSNAKRSDF